MIASRVTKGEFLALGFDAGWFVSLRGAGTATSADR